MILITGFEVFLNHRINPSQELSLALNEYDPVRFRSLILPVVYKKSFEKLDQLIQNFKEFPEKIILMGFSEQRSYISIEKLALNWIESSHPDNHGEIIKGKKIIKEAPAVYIHPDESLLLRYLPYAPVEISYFSGTYVCNELYFRTLHRYYSLNKKILFIHLPSYEKISFKNQKEILLSIIDSF